MEADHQALEDIIKNDKTKYSQTELSAYLKVFARRILLQEAEINDLKSQMSEMTIKMAEKNNPVLERADNCSGFDVLLTKNVPHILEKIFFSLDYKSFITCREVSKLWKELLTSKSFQMKEKSVYIMELRDHIKRAMEKSLVKGDTWYLCDVRWFMQLKKYLNGGGHQANIGDPLSHPGHIDLSGLFQDGNPNAGLREHMIHAMDYVPMPESAWDNLVEIFGLTQGQNPVARKVIERGIHVKRCHVEVYLMELKLAEMTNLNDVHFAKFSRGDTLGRPVMRLKCYMLGIW